MAQSPFPGMDPYLEAADLWPDVHESLMSIFREQLMPLLAPRYVAELGTRIVIERVVNGGPPHPRDVLPDVTITRPGRAGDLATATETIAPPPLRLTLPLALPTRLVTIYIRRRETDRLVTVIELLSPVNKRPGEGRQEYLSKREAYLDSDAHLVEVDLLRRWPRMPFGGDLPDTDYLAMVSVAHERPDCDAWPIGLREPLPVLPIPLEHPDPPAPLDLGRALRTAYQRARYDLRVDYGAPPTPPLSPDDADWAVTLLA